MRARLLQENIFYRFFSVHHHEARGRSRDRRVILHHYYKRSTALLSQETHRLIVTGDPPPHYFMRSTARTPSAASREGGAFMYGGLGTSNSQKTTHFLAIGSLTPNVLKSQKLFQRCVEPQTNGASFACLNGVFQAFRYGHPKQFC